MDKKFQKLIDDLHHYLDNEEMMFSQKLSKISTLFDHSLRVAKFSRKIARSEKSVSEDIAFLGGLFHDAGKFKNGQYHVDGENEEYRSAKIVKQLLPQYGYNKQIVDKIVTAIQDLHQDDHCPTKLSQIIQDADNLDKLAELGVANFFLKAGLRGQGIGEDLFFKISIELTYAFHAVNAMWTETGKQLARKKSKKTFVFFEQFIKSLNEDGLSDFQIEKIPYQNREFYSIFKSRCECGGSFKRKISNEKTLRCDKISMQYRCSNCDKQYEVSFCSPNIKSV